MRKRVLFIGNSIDGLSKTRKILAGIESDIAACSTRQVKSYLAPGTCLDLIIFEAWSSTRTDIEEVESLVDVCRCPLLVIVDKERLARLVLPVLVPSDFIMLEAAASEYLLRVQRLIAARQAGTTDDIIRVDDMTLNLSTYQVTVADKPIDLTYREYALLAFFVQHPNHAFTREEVLQSVWGFDYYGGTRTVDVHVRRVRAKLGAGLALHLETVRGVGYYWSTD